MKKILIVLAALFATVAAIAQTSPGFVYGQTPSAAQWNSYFSSKMDYTVTVPISKGGTGASSAAQALLNLAGSVPADGQYLRGNGTGFAVSSIQFSDIPGSPEADNLGGGSVGAVPYQSAFSTTLFLAGNTSTTPKFLTSTGSGSAATTPTFTTSVGSGSVVLSTSPSFTTDASSPKWRSTTAKVLFQGTGTGATQMSSTQTTVPTCSSNCGTSPSVAGSDSDGIVTMGGTGSPASGWVVTFNGTWAAAPACIVQASKTGMLVGKMPIVVATTTTTFTVTTNGTAPATSDTYAYHCRGTS